jgi:HAD superfamily hydrolase (TIGR01490 family)
MAEHHRRVAFFDIDGTVFRSSLLIELVKAFIHDGVFPKDAEAGYIREFQAWVRREGTYEAYISAAVATFLKHLKGVHYGTLADTGRAVVTQQERHVYRYTRDLLKKLKSEGVYLVAISQSPKTILDEFCASYGFDKVYGRIYELGPTDCFTGMVADEHIIANKANIARRVSEKEDISLGNACAVGDTEGDIPLLELVGEAICFNPNKVLYDHAKRMGWKVVVERKDVIYEGV